MNRRQKKARAKQRSQQWAAEKVLAVLSGANSHGVLRHGNSWTFRK